MVKAAEAVPPAEVMIEMEDIRAEVVASAPVLLKEISIQAHVAEDEASSLIMQDHQVTDLQAIENGLRATPVVETSRLVLLLLETTDCHRAQAKDPIRSTALLN